MAETVEIGQGLARKIVESCGIAASRFRRCFVPSSGRPRNSACLSLCPKNLPVRSCCANASIEERFLAAFGMTAYG